MNSRKTLYILTSVLLLASFPAVAQRQRRDPGSTRYLPVTVYDPKRDAAQDLASAIKEAQRTHRNVMVEVGGEWCSWCHTLDNFFKEHRELVQLRDRNFVTLKINFSEENQNTELLSRYPEISGYPHIFFLDENGKLLQSQDTGLWESGHSYDLEKLSEALRNWKPK